ncbi:MAG: long-chain fatty acid--CoA ligase [Acidimicrobiia bacterium]|nr:long-chain fatty acid--CoA ligase [Acidimicrobiia bacterium]MDX2466955.1 long-chain fatty acid--CoA ligase [Acidimicrobiia bacterium]
MGESRLWHQHYQEGVPTEVTWPDGPLDGLLRAAASKYPDRPALVFFDRALTFSQVDEIVDQLAAGLQDLGLVPGDRVSLFMPNSPQLVVAYEAVWRCGAVAVPSNPLYTATEFAHQAADAGSRFAIALSMMYDRVKEARPNTPIEHVIVTNIKEYFKGPLKALFTVLRERKGGHRVDVSGDADTHEWNDVLADHAPQPVDVASQDLAMLMYTGGTTGVPKGAMLTHQNMMANAYQTKAWGPEGREGEEVMLTALPLTHSYSATVAMNHSIAAGFTQLLIPDARDLGALLKVIDTHHPTYFPGVPTLYSAITRHRHVISGKYDVSSINWCISGAAALPPEVKRNFEAITGGRLVEGYGLSEASPVTHANPLDGTAETGRIGLPLPNTDCRIVDEDTETRVVKVGERGVLCISGPQVMQGYWNMPDATKDVLRTDADGKVWLHTGDVAVMDGRGHFAIVDRKKDMILAAGGFNVYPREVEDALFEHQDVVDAGVIGVPVGGQDQRVKAFVVLEEGKSLTEDDLIEFCRDRLARYKLPRSIEFRDELPKTFVGKVLRRELMAEEKAKQAD